MIQRVYSLSSSEQNSGNQYLSNIALNLLYCGGCANTRARKEVYSEVIYYYSGKHFNYHSRENNDQYNVSCQGIEELASDHEEPITTWDVYSLTAQKLLTPTSHYITFLQYNTLRLLRYNTENELRL